MSPNRNLLLVGTAILALMIAVLRLAGCGHRARPETAAINFAYLEALAEGVAETAAEGANGGRCVVLLPKRDGTAQRRDRRLAPLLERALRRAGFEEVELRWLEPEQMGAFGGVAVGVFEEFLRANAETRALVSMAGPPLSPPARVASAHGRVRTVIVEEEAAPDPDRTGPLLATKAVDAAVRPRGALAADAGRNSTSPREAFRKLFEVETP